MPSLPLEDESPAPPSSRDETIVIEKSIPSQRLDAFLPTKFPATSRSAVQRLIEAGHIRVNGAPTKATHTPRAGDIITIHWPEARPAIARPEDIPLDVLFEDKHLLVLNKPPGIVVHPSAGHDKHTLVNALLHHCAGQLSGIGGVARPGIVHRLDQETSGCLVVAKTDAAHLDLAEQFAGRTIKKIYHALVCGLPSRDSGEIHAAIARHSTHRKRMAVTDAGAGREAWTSYAVVKRFAAAALVELRLHTGRTHQIRVHLQHLGFPVVGDTIYGPRQNKRLTELTGVSAPRQMLHASKLTFTHPHTGKKVAVEARLPKDFCAVMKKLKRKNSV